MTTRIEIIAQIDDELGRLERARDFLVAALAGSRNDSKTASAIASLKRAKIKLPGRAASNQPWQLLLRQLHCRLGPPLLPLQCRHERSRKYGVFLPGAGWNGGICQPTGRASPARR